MQNKISQIVCEIIDNFQKMNVQNEKLNYFKGKHIKS
jgi:hypothetical protein